MIQNIFLSFAWPSPGIVILLLFLFGMVGITIALELRKMKREREQGQYKKWYQQPGIFLGAMQAVALLILLANLVLIRPPLLFSSTITIAGMVIILALGISALDGSCSRSWQSGTLLVCVISSASRLAGSRWLQRRDVLQASLHPAKSPLRSSRRSLYGSKEHISWLD